MKFFDFGLFGFILDVQYFRVVPAGRVVVVFK